MVPVICDVCGEVFTTDLVPNYVWKFGDTEEMIHMCGECVKDTSLHIRARTIALKPATVTVELPPHKLPPEPVEETEEEEEE